MKQLLTLLTILLLASCTSSQSKLTQAQACRATGAQENKDGKSAEAIASYTKAIYFNPKDDSAYFYRGALYHNLGQLDQALTDYKKAIEVAQPPFSELITNAYVNIGNIYSVQQKNIMAQKNYDDGIEALPNSGQLYYQRGLTRQRLGNKQGALEDYNKAIELGHYVVAYTYRAALRSNMGDNRGALEDFTLLIQNDSTGALSISNYRNRGLVYSSLNKLDSAILDFKQSLALSHKPLDSTSVGTLMSIAYIYYNQKKYTQAQEAYSQVLKLSKNYTAYCNRGNIRFMQGNKTGAIDDYTNAIGLNASDINNYYNRGAIYGSLGNYDKALADFNQIVTLFSDKLQGKMAADVYLNLGVIYYSQNKFDLAIENLNAGIERVPDDGRLYYQRAATKLKLNNNAGACEDAHKAKSLGIQQADILLKSCS